MLRRDRRAAADAAATATHPTRRELLRWCGWFAAVNLLLVALVSLRNLTVVDAPDGTLALLFTVLMFVGHCGLLAALPCLALVPLILTWPRRPPLVLLATALEGFLVFATLTDTVVFLQYRFHLNPEIYNLLFGGAAGEILVLPMAMYVQTAIAVAAVVAVELLVGRLLWRRLPAPRRRLGYAVAVAISGAFLVQGAIHAWADVRGYVPVTRQTRLLLAYLPVTAEQLLARLGFEAERADRALVSSVRGTSLAYPLRPLDCRPPAMPPNVLFVVIDGWRADALTEAVTPNAWRLARTSLRFQDHLSGGSATRTGIFSLFYAIPGTYWHSMLAERRGPVFVSELFRQGYEVSAFGSATLVNPEFDRTVFAEVDDLRLQSDGATPSARDQDTTDDFITFLDHRTGDRPFFGFLFYDAPHGYDLPDDSPQPFQPSWDEVNYYALHDGFDPVPFKNRYLNCVHFDDALVGRVLETLEGRGLLENTVIVLTGDHGEEFNETGLNYWGHDGNFSSYQVAVPLVLRWPGREPATLDHRTSHFDVVPTLMRDALGCASDYADYSVGRHLLEPGGRELLLLANYVDYAVVQPDRIMAVYPHGVELLDLSYRRIPGARPERELLLAALELRSRFYR